MAVGKDIGNLLGSAQRNAYFSINVALSLIMAFAWLDAIRFFIDRLVKNPKQKGVWLVVNAMIITLIAVLVMSLLSSISKQRVKSIADQYVSSSSNGKAVRFN